MRSLSARASFSHELRRVDGGVEHAVAGQGDGPDLHAAFEEEEDLIRGVALVAKVRALAVVPDAARFREAPHRGGDTPRRSG